LASPAPAPKAKATFSSLRNRTFRTLAAAALFSNLGSFIQITAAAWLMTTLTSSNTLVAAVQSAAALPIMLFAMLAGAMADIYDKRSQMIISMTFNCACVFVLVALYLLGLLGPLSLLFLTAMLGIGIAFYSAAWQSSLPEIVSDEHFVSAVSVNSLGFSIARLVGPMIAAELLIRFDASVGFVINGISYIFLVGALLLWNRDVSPNTLPRETLIGAIGDGFRYAAISSASWSTLLRSGSFAFCTSVVLAMPPLIVLSLNGDARDLGVLLVGFGLGATAGALLIARLRSLGSQDNVVLGSSIAIAAAIALVAASKAIWLSAAGLFVCGVFWVQVVSMLQISIQTSCPRWVAGRMVALLSMTFSGGIAAGSATWGLIAELLSVSLALFIAAGATVATALLVRLLPFDPPAAEDLEPQNTDLLDKAPKLHANAGPIIVEVHYEVEPENVPAFLDAVWEVGRIRKRDGARRWTLAQSIENNAIWTERFESPTWAAYMHRVSRRVAGDVPVLENVTRLCRTPPVWHRRLERSAGAKPLENSPNSLPS
jgi:MFS family permease